MPAKVRLIDRAGSHVCWLERDEARRLLAAGEVEAVQRHSGASVWAVRWTMSEPADEPRRLYVIRKRGYGDPHRRETPENPPGVWTIDRIRPSHRHLFVRVLAERLAA